MPNIVYNLDERIWITQARYQGLTYRSMRDYFAADYPDRPIPCIRTIGNIIQNFERYGCVDPTLRKVVQPNRALSEDQRLSIYLSAINDPTLSLSQRSDELGISKTAIWNVLHDEKFSAYKMTCHQQFVENDPWNRLKFCQEMIDKLHEDPQLIDYLIMTDECTFHIDRAPNRQNTRFWMQKNPFEVVSNKTQWQVSVNVWAGLVGDKKIGPFFIEEKLTAKVYLNLLEQHVLPAIRQLPNNVSIS